MYVKTINTKKFHFFVKNVMVFFKNYFLYFYHLVIGTSRLSCFER